MEFVKKISTDPTCIKPIIILLVSIVFVLSLYCISELNRDFQEMRYKPKENFAPVQNDSWSLSKEFLNNSENVIPQTISQQTVTQQTITNPTSFQFVETDTLPNINYDSLIQNSDILGVFAGNGAPLTKKVTLQNKTGYDGTNKPFTESKTEITKTFLTPKLIDDDKTKDDLFTNLTVYNNVYKEGKTDYDAGFPTLSPILVKTGLSICQKECPGTCVEYGYTGIANCFL